MAAAAEPTKQRKKSIFQKLGAAVGLSSEPPAPAAKPQMSIGLPFNVKHAVHVKPDATSELGLSGLPSTWESALATSGISKQEVCAPP